MGHHLVALESVPRRSARWHTLCHGTGQVNPRWCWEGGRSAGVFVLLELSVQGSAADPQETGRFGFVVLGLG